MVVGLLMAGGLLLIGAATGAWQVRTARRLRADPFLPGADRLYLRGQVRRRAAAAGVLVAIGGMIGGYYLSGMDARVNAVGPPPHSDDDRRFVRQVGWYWIAVLGLVFAVACLAVLDFWATRVFWMARYREMRADHEAKLQRDLAVYRHQKLNDRMKGRRADGDPPPNPDDTPPPR